MQLLDFSFATLVTLTAATAAVIETLEQIRVLSQLEATFSIDSNVEVGVASAAALLVLLFVAALGSRRRRETFGQHL